MQFCGASRKEVVLFRAEQSFLCVFQLTFFRPQNTQNEQMTFGFLPCGLTLNRKLNISDAEHSISHVAIRMILRFVIVFMCVLHGKLPQKSSTEGPHVSSIVKSASFILLWLF